MTVLAKKLNLEIGTRVMVHFEGADVPVKGIFIGMEPSRYLILRLPSGAGLNKYLYANKKLVVKYVSAGKVFGFQSQIFGHFMKRGLIAAFISYPFAVETYELRSQRRIDCLIPARLESAGQMNQGFILDISANGCRFGLSLISEDSPVIPSVDEQVKLLAGFLGMEGTQEILCLIKSVNDAKRSFSLGLMFVEMNEALREGLDRYIRKALDYIESSGF